MTYSPYDLDSIVEPLEIIFPNWTPPETGERRMLAVILGDAVADFAKGRAEATSWIFDEPEEPAFKFTFERACEILDLDPEYLRAGLLRYSREELRRRLRKRPQSGLKTRVGVAA